AVRARRVSTALVAAATPCRCHGLISALFRAQPPNLRFASLMDMDFAVSWPLVRRLRLVSGLFCPSARTFAPRFLTWGLRCQEQKSAGKHLFLSGVTIMW